MIYKIKRVKKDNGNYEIVRFKSIEMEDNK